MPRLVQSLLGRDDAGQVELDDLVPPLDLAPGRHVAPVDVERRDDRRAWQLQQFGHHGGHLHVVVVDRLLAEQQEVELHVTQCVRERASHDEAVRRGIGAEQQRLVRPHGERGAERFLRRVGTQADDGDFPFPRCLPAGDRLFEGELVVRVHDVLHAGRIEGTTVRADIDARLRVGDALHAHDGFHGNSIS